MIKHGIAFFLLSTLFFTSCKVYKQDIMFTVEEGFQSADIELEVNKLELNYQLLVDDYIQIEVFTNKGERAIDPNFEFGNQQAGQNLQQTRDRFQYLIQADGSVKLPMVGKMQIAGLTVDQAEEMLEEAYNVPYKESFVKLKVLNRRVIVLGAFGGKVVPLNNENTSLIEIMAMYGGLNMGAKAANIRILRGDLKNPTVFQVDLSSVEGMKHSIIPIQSGDVIYIEPWRRPWQETVKDISPFFNILTSTLALVILIQRL